MTPPLSSAQAVKAAAVKIARDFHWTPPMYVEDTNPNEASDDSVGLVKEQIANTIEALPIAPDDRDEKIRRAVEALEKIKAASHGTYTRDVAAKALTELTGSQKP